MNTTGDEQEYVKLCDFRLLILTPYFDILRGLPQVEQGGLPLNLRTLTIKGEYPIGGELPQ
jgi:hypothetical protein